MKYRECNQWRCIENAIVRVQSRLSNQSTDHGAYIRRSKNKIKPKSTMTHKTKWAKWKRFQWAIGDFHECSVRVKGSIRLPALREHFMGSVTVTVFSRVFFFFYFDTATVQICSKVLCVINIWIVYSWI